MLGEILWLYWDNGKENENYYSRCGVIGSLGFRIKISDSGKVQGFERRVRDLWFRA